MFWLCAEKLNVLKEATDNNFLLRNSPVTMGKRMSTCRAEAVNLLVVCVKTETGVSICRPVTEGKASLSEGQDAVCGAMLMRQPFSSFTAKNS
jgi:hypothetical protein